tara:strand:- start:3163 stop:4317 length:1155 start_codon:yes stop_codon:yes gene_type:complete
MKKTLLLILTYLSIFLNSTLLSNETKEQLKIGLLVPFTGEYKDLGNSFLYSIQLALEEIGDKNITIIPRDSGTKNPSKLEEATKEIISEGAKVIIGPISFQETKNVYKFNDTVFISPSNMDTEIKKNVINIGISLESQLIALKKFLDRQKKYKTVILFPNDKFAGAVEEKIKKIGIKYHKIFKYNSDPKILTGEIETLTNYDQRKKNLEIRKKILEQREDEKSKKELEKLEQIYTLGKVNFDSIIVIDFGHRLKSVLSSLVFSDVNQNEVLFTTINQWFDKSIFYENSIKEIYYPSVNFKNFSNFREEYYKSFKMMPSEITILGYDAVGLIYYVWKKNNSINNVKNFIFKEKIKGKIGRFNLKEGSVIQDLKIYQAKNKSFKEY